jgi:ABC-type lipoprotein release transport system permease subunit
LVTDVVVRLAPDVDPDAVRTKAARTFHGARIITKHDMLATADAFLDGRRGLPAVLILAMALALVIVVADKPSALSVEEQKEIGTLRALGWSKMEVLAAKVWESMSVSITALLVGLLMAYAHVYVWQAALFAPVLRGWAVLAPNLHLVPSLDIPFLAAIVASILLLPASGTLFAAHRPASGDPDAAIRP